MEEHGNVGRVRDALETFNRGDLDVYREFFNDDVVWFVRGTHPMAGAYRGIDALFDYFGRARNVTRGSLRILAGFRAVERWRTRSRRRLGRPSSAAPR